MVAKTWCKPAALDNNGQRPRMESPPAFTAVRLQPKSTQAPPLRQPTNYRHLTQEPGGGGGEGGGEGGGGGAGGAAGPGVECLVSMFLRAGTPGGRQAQLRQLRLSLRSLSPTDRPTPTQAQCYSRSLGSSRHLHLIQSYYILFLAFLQLPLGLGPWHRLGPRGTAWPCGTGTCTHGPFPARALGPHKLLRLLHLHLLLRRVQVVRGDDRFAGSASTTYTSSMSSPPSPALDLKGSAFYFTLLYFTPSPASSVLLCSS